MNMEIKHRIATGTWMICTEPQAFPCDGGRACPYDRGKKPLRNIKGMPLIDWDSRSCPTYGHVCPSFMESFGLTPEDLRIRATLHLGRLLRRIEEIRETTKNADQVLSDYEKTLAQYPKADHPEYYV